MNAISIHIHTPTALPLRIAFGDMPMLLATDTGAAPAIKSMARFVNPPETKGVVIDNDTRLMWSADTIGEPMPWAQAKAAAEAVRLGGFTDWRLPTIHELLSIVDYTRSDPAIDTSFFKSASAWYWTGTAWAAQPADYAWIVNFNNGNSGYYHRSYDARVRAVRSVSGAGQ